MENRKLKIGSSLFQPATGCLLIKSNKFTKEFFNFVIAVNVLSSS